MKRMRKIITAAVIAIAAVFVSLSVLPANAGKDSVSYGFPQNAPQLLAMEAQDFSNVYQRITGEMLSPDCLISDTAKQYAVRAVWFSYLDWQQYLTAVDEDEFIQKADAAVKQCADLGLNTIILQLRAFGDAFYPSDCYPFSRYVTVDGKAPDYDPLALFLESAKRYGLSVEGWINPFRLDADAQMQALDPDSRLGKLYSDAEKHMQQAKNGVWWLDPADADAVKLICDGVKELCRYDLSGIQIDDYFYSGVSPKGFGYSQKKAKAALTEFVRQLHETIREAGEGMRFGISPQGNIDAGLIPASDEKLCTSLSDWCEAGYIDYLMPQVYYGFLHQTADYQTVAKRWEQLISGTECELYIGLAFYKCGKEDEFAGSGLDEWLTSRRIIARQIECSAEYAKGFGLFRYGSVFDCVNETAEKEREAVAALLW